MDAPGDEGVDDYPKVRFHAKMLFMLLDPSLRAHTAGLYRSRKRSMTAASASISTSTSAPELRAASMRYSINQPLSSCVRSMLMCAISSDGYAALACPTAEGLSVARKTVLMP